MASRLVGHRGLSELWRVQLQTHCLKQQGETSPSGLNMRTREACPARGNPRRAGRLLILNGFVKELRQPQVCRGVGFQPATLAECVVFNLHHPSTIRIDALMRIFSKMRDFTQAVCASCFQCLGNHLRRGGNFFCQLPFRHLPQFENRRKLWHWNEMHGTPRRNRKMRIMGLSADIYLPGQSTTDSDLVDSENVVFHAPRRSPQFARLSGPRIPYTAGLHRKPAEPGSP